MGSGAGEYNLFPNGNINVSTFVKLDTTQGNGYYVVQAGSGDKPYGISGPETHSMAIVLSGASLDDGYAGVAGGPAIHVYGVGATNVLLRIGGTVTVGDRLIPDTDGSGRGITSTTPGATVGAIARYSGVADDIIAVDVVMFDL